MWPTLYVDCHPLSIVAKGRSVVEYNDAGWCSVVQRQVIVCSYLQAWYSGHAQHDPARPQNCKAARCAKTVAIEL